MKCLLSIEDQLFKNVIIYIDGFSIELSFHSWDKPYLLITYYDGFDLLIKKMILAPNWYIIFLDRYLLDILLTVMFILQIFYECF